MRLHSTLAASLRAAAMSGGVVVFLTICIGWLYWLRGPTAHWPGPRISDALPLDELSGHASVSLLVFCLVLALGGLVTGMFARLLRFDGFSIALAVGAATGAWLYTASAISLFIVRQVPLDNAFDVTRDLPPVYIAATLFALAVGLSAHRRSEERWITQLVPECVGLFGTINLLAATLPESLADRVALGGLLSPPTSPVTRTLEVTIGIILLLCSRGLGRRSRRALWMAVLLVFVCLVSRIIDGFNVASFVAGALVLLSLLARRSDFSYSGDPSTRSAGVIRLTMLFLCAITYGVSALLINRIGADLPFHFLPALRATMRALVIGSPPQASFLTGGFSEWFPWSLRAIVALGIVWGATTWFAPWRHRPVNLSDRRRHAKQLVKTWGGDTLAPFTLRQDKALYFYPDTSEAVSDATTLIAYRVVRGVAIVSGDPVGPISQAPLALAAFRQMSMARGWRFALVGASDRLLDVYKELGLRALYHGDEAIIDVPEFSLDGGELKSVRQAFNRVSRKGYSVEILQAGEIHSAARQEMLEFERRSRAGDKQKGFVMEFDELFRLDGDDAIFVIGRNSDGELAGFLAIALCPASFSLSLSSMPRSPDAPNGLNAFLIVAAVGWAREHDYRALSLNFSPAARLFDRDTAFTGWKRLARRALLIFKSLLGLQLDNLLVFNGHFAPRWQPRFVIVDRLLDVPRVVIAAMAAERYLPFADLLRGRDWSIANGNADDGRTSTSR